jgi:dienelactone hydrolase
MVPFARRISALGAGRVAVARLRYAVRGWNGTVDEAPVRGWNGTVDEAPVRGWNGTADEAAPVRDARWALAELTARYPGRPIGLVGHSMGGRAALAVGGHHSVRAVVGLAPWIKTGDEYRQLAGRKVLLMHGTADRMTDPAHTAALASALTEIGVETTLLRMPGEGHAMLHRPGRWHDAAARFVLQCLLPSRSVPPADPNSLSSGLSPIVG